MPIKKLYLHPKDPVLDPIIISKNVQIAENFISRGVGLIGKTQLPENSALWIKRCSHIHTCFMKFSIDTIFVDKNLIVKKIFINAKPWRHLFLGVWGADSVFELPQNSLAQLNIHKGDQLYVGT